METYQIRLRALAIWGISAGLTVFYFAVLKFSTATSGVDGVMQKPLAQYMYFAAVLVAKLLTLSVVFDSLNRPAHFSIREVYYSWYAKHPFVWYALWLYVWLTMFLAQLYALWYQVDGVFGISNRPMNFMIGLVCGVFIKDQLSGILDAWDTRYGQGQSDNVSGGAQ